MIDDAQIERMKLRLDTVERSGFATVSLSIRELHGLLDRLAQTETAARVLARCLEQETWDIGGNLGWREFMGHRFTLEENAVLDALEAWLREAG